MNETATAADGSGSGPPPGGAMKLEYQRHRGTRMFKNGFLEACSKVHPSVPFLFYLPLVLSLGGWALLTGVTSASWTAAMLVLGWLSWAVLEYLIHRHLFHFEGIGPVSRRLHQLVHGYHHRYPDDATRLVMPLGVSIPLALLIGGLLSLAGYPAATVPYFCGIVLGYLFYDFTHWSTHYRPPRTRWGKALRAHHMAHHFAAPELNFGISQRWMDRLLGTLKR